MSRKPDLPQGTLDLLILQIAALGPIHGYAIARRIQQISRDVLEVPQGSPLSGAPPPREPEAARGGVEGVRDGARREVLPPHAPPGARRLEAESAGWKQLADGRPADPPGRRRRCVMRWLARLLRRDAAERELDAELRYDFDRRVGGLRRVRT